MSNKTEIFEGKVVQVEKLVKEEAMMSNLNNNQNKQGAVKKPTGRTRLLKAMIKK